MNHLLRQFHARACSRYWSGGAGSQFFRVQGVRSDAYRVSASDDRRGNRENWPRPEGLRRKIGPYVILALDGGPATAFGLGFVSHPTDEDLSVGTPVWPNFRSQRHPP